MRLSIDDFTLMPIFAYRPHHSRHQPGAGASIYATPSDLPLTFLAFGAARLDLNAL